MKRLAETVLPNGVLRKLEYERQQFIGFNERGVEYAFVFKWLSRLRPRTVLDVGTGETALPSLIRTYGSLVDAIDKKPNNTHYHVQRHDVLDYSDKKYDMITCISTLEHIRESLLAVDNMISLLNDRGHLIITCPYTQDNYIDNVYDLPGSNAYEKDIDYICQSFCATDVYLWTKYRKLISQEYYNCWSGDFWSAGKQIRPVRTKTNHDLTCILIKR